MRTTKPDPGMRSAPFLVDIEEPWCPYPLCDKELDVAYMDAEGVHMTTCDCGHIVLVSSVWDEDEDGDEFLAAYNTYGTAVPLYEGEK